MAPIREGGTLSEDKGPLSVSSRLYGGERGGLGSERQIF